MDTLPVVVFALVQAVLGYLILLFVVTVLGQDFVSVNIGMYISVAIGVIMVILFQDANFLFGVGLGVLFFKSVFPVRSILRKIFGRRQ